MPETIVGRGDELATIDRFLAAAAHQPRALVIAGEPGIGKTTLWRAALDRLAPTSIVLETRPLEADARRSLTGLADMARDVDRAIVEALPAPQALAIDVVCQRADPGPGVDHQLVAAAVHSLLRALAAERPVVVAIDDVQWLDRPSARVLESVARRLREVPVTFLVGLRTNLGSAPRPTFLETSLESRRVVRLDLGGLSAPEVGELIADRLGRRLPPSLVSRIEQSTGGNPLFALGVARRLPDDLEPLAALPIADSVFDLAKRRLSRLPPVPRQALLAAASLATALTAIVVAAVDQPAAAVLGALESAEAAGLITLDQVVRFTHPVLAGAMYAMASPSERRRVHRRLSELVSDPEERARHLALGTVGPDEQVAAALDEAASGAALAGAPDSAQEFGLLALKFTPPDARDALNERTVRAAEYAYHAGDTKRVADLVAPLLASNPAPHLRADALRVLGDARFLERSIGEAISLYADALQWATASPALTARLELDLAFATVSTGDFAGTEPHAKRAIAAAEAAGDSATIAEAEAVRAMVEFLLGRGLNKKALTRALALEDRNRQTSLEMRPTLIAGYLHLYEAHFAEARRLLTPLEQRLEERGEFADLSFLQAYLCFAEVWAGDLARAAQYAEKATSNAAGPSHRAFAYAFRALMHGWAGERAACDRDAEETESAVRESGYAIALFWSRWGRALIELAEDRPAEALAALEGMDHGIEAHVSVEPIRLPFASDAIEALIATKQLDRAERGLNALAEAAERLDRGWARLAAARARTALLTARGDPRTALAVADVALADPVLATLPWEHARLLLAQARAARALRRRREAWHLYTEAERRFAARGAALWAHRARAERKRLGLERTDGRLTPSERAIARLAASGLTNRAVADRLSISPKTVEASLARVYDKLGIHSRAELGARRDEFQGD